VVGSLSRDRRSAAYHAGDERIGASRSHVAEPQVFLVHQFHAVRVSDDLAQHERLGAELNSPVQISAENVILLNGGSTA